MKIRCYQHKMDYFIREIFYVSLMVTTEQNSGVDSCNIKKKKKTEHITMENTSFRGRKKQRRKETK